MVKILLLFYGGWKYSIQTTSVEPPTTQSLLLVFPYLIGLSVSEIPQLNLYLNEKTLLNLLGTTMNVCNFKWNTQSFIFKNVFSVYILISVSFPEIFKKK